MATEKSSSAKDPSEDEDDDSGEKKEGKSVDNSREGITSPNSLADAIAPTGSEEANTFDGEDESGREDGALVGPRAYSIVSSSVTEERIPWVLRLADLIIFLSNDSDDLGAGNAASVLFSAALSALAAGSVSKQLGSRKESKSVLVPATRLFTFAREVAPSSSLLALDLFLIKGFLLR